MGPYGFQDGALLLAELARASDAFRGLVARLRVPVPRSWRIRQQAPGAALALGLGVAEPVELRQAHGVSPFADA